MMFLGNKYSKGNYFKRYIIAFLFALSGCASVSAVSTSDSAIETADQNNKESTKRYAVLVGVTKYPNLRNVDLIGPKNDAILMRDVLLNKGFEPENMHLLVDDVEGGIEPTRTNILASLNSVTEKVKPGDYVYMHFAGHGSQAPVALDKLSDSNELDGLDEIFLPKDAKNWDFNIGEVTNAIKDDEVAVVISSIRNKGAFVWAVFDSCHSGTMTRSMVTMRKLSPESLGIPTTLIDEVKSKAVSSKVTSRGGSESTKTESPFTNSDILPSATNDVQKGGYVAFFAAQTTQTTPEMKLPTKSDHKKDHGLFTYFISQVLSTVNGNISYKQAAEEILQNYNTHPWRQSTPLFEGDLDAALLGQEIINNSEQWKVSVVDGEIEIDAGSFHQLNEGAILSIVKSPVSKEIIGYAQITDLYPLRSVASVYEKEGQVVIDVDKIPDNAYARIEENIFNVSLSYGYEINANVEKSERETLEGVLENLKAETDGGLALIPVQEGDPADIRLLAIDHKLYFLGDDEDYPCVAEYMSKCDELKKQRKFIKIPLSSDMNSLEKQVRQRLLVIAKANNLRRLGSVLGDAKDHLQTTFKHKRGSKTMDFPASGNPQLLAGDKLEVIFQNNHDQDIDVNMFFIDSDYGVTQLYPKNNGQSNRLHPDQKITKKLKINADTIGRESILIIATEANRNSAYSNFSFLQQESLNRTRGAPKVRGGIAGINTFLLQSGFGADKGISTRGVATDDSESSVSGVQLFSFDTIPN